MIPTTYLFDETDKLGGVPLRSLNASMAGLPCPVETVSAPGSLKGLRRRTTAQRVHCVLFPFRRARLKRNIKAWLPDAIKKGPRSVEADFVAEWSFELRHYFGS